MRKPLALIILDGFGIRHSKMGNAIAAAKMPNYRSLLKQWPHTALAASGQAVGLPAGYQGNSEVGHLTIGAGRTLYQMLARIDHAIEDNSFFHNPEFLKAIQHCRKYGGALHLIGLVQDQGVHAHERHLYALLKLCAQQKLKQVWIHMISDGRDTPPRSALRYLHRLERQLRQLHVGQIATVSGRFYSMDRDKRWNRTAQAYRAIAEGRGMHTLSAHTAITGSYLRGTSDEFIIPAVIGSYAGMQRSDAAIFFNFRLDRARQLTHAFTDRSFNQFRRTTRPALFIAMSEYFRGLPHVAFPEITVRNLLGSVLARRGIRQLRIAETEKYAHVTYFFNGQQEHAHKGEDRILVPSERRVPTYDRAPQMRAIQIANRTVLEILKGKYDVLIVNFANPDMVGHTGNFAATVKALNTVDHCIAEVISTLLRVDGIAIVTADHGNCEAMLDRNQQPLTAHTTNPVPFIIVGKKVRLRKQGTLADIAPTMLELMDIPKPKEMTGRSLLR